MQLTKLAWVTTAILITGTVASCNIGKAPEPTPDVNAIYTQAAQTSVAGFNADQTQTAEAVPTATATVQAAAPLPTFAISGTGVIPSGVTPGRTTAVPESGNVGSGAAACIVAVAVGTACAVCVWSALNPATDVWAACV